MIDYYHCKAKQREWMAEAKTPGLESEVRRLFVQWAVMYRRHALQWKVLN